MRAQDQVKGFGHQAKAQHPHGRPVAGGGDEGEKRLVVSILAKDGGPGVATIDDVVARSLADAQAVRDGRGKWRQKFDPLSD